MQEVPKIGAVYYYKRAGTNQPARKKYIIRGIATYRPYGYPVTLVIFKPLLGWKWLAESLDDFNQNYVRG